MSKEEQAALVHQILEKHGIIMAKLSNTPNNLGRTPYLCLVEGLHGAGYDIVRKTDG